MKTPSHQDLVLRVVADPEQALVLAGVLGGKAFNLARLEGAGMPVPPPGMR